MSIGCTFETPSNQDIREINNMYCLKIEKFVIKSLKLKVNKSF